MSSRLRTATEEHSAFLNHAVLHLRKARDCMAAADCPLAMKAIRHALKSAEGAQRHMSHRLRQTKERA